MYKSYSIACADVKFVIELFAFTELQLPDNEIVKSLQIDLPSEMLYSSEMLKAPTSLYRIHKDFLVENCLPYNPHPNIGRISHALLETLYTDEWSREKLVLRFKIIVLKPAIQFTTRVPTLMLLQ